VTRPLSPAELEFIHNLKNRLLGLAIVEKIEQGRNPELLNLGEGMITQNNSTSWLTLESREIASMLYRWKATWL
jgi:hypothetical protein